MYENATAQMFRRIGGSAANGASLPSKVASRRHRPATENQDRLGRARPLADAKAAVDAATLAFAGGAGSSRRERAEIVRKSY